MKHIYLFLITLLFASHSMFAQDSTASNVNWEFSAQKTSDNKYQLTFKGTIKQDWRLFSTTAKDDELNTRVVFDSATLANNEIGAVNESGSLVTKKEPLLDNMEIRYFQNMVEFTVPVTVKVPGKNIRGSLQFMAMKADEVTGPTEAPFVFSIDGTGNISAKEGGLAVSADAAAKLTRTKIDITNPVNTCGGTGLEDNEAKSLSGIFILGFLGGLIGLLTPCVFPMIPLTVSFFTKSSGGRKKGIFNALLYGFFYPVDLCIVECTISFS